MRRVTLGAEALLVAVTLTACGGGSSGPDPTLPGPMSPPVTGPATEVEDVVELADRLLASALHARWALSDGEVAIQDSTIEMMRCSGGRCVGEDGEEVTVAGLRGAFDRSGAAGAVLGKRDGFDTVMTRGAVPEVVIDTPEATGEGATVTASPQATSWGVWGEHGFAILVLNTGSLEAEVGGDTYTGTFSAGVAYALGDATGTNPEGPQGMGSAVWRGVAEAASTVTFERLAGTATVTIADLSQPRVGVEIAVPGHDIGAPGWADIPLADGRFATGAAGTDYLAGDFHGPAHEEAWGVFDTGAYIGGFGTKRAPP